MADLTPEHLEGLTKRLRERFTPEPVPPCRVCGAPLAIARAGGGAATQYACSAAKPPGEWMEHYERSQFTHHRPGDSDVLRLLDAIEAAESRATAAEARASALDEALTPSDRTKAAYIGEFRFPFTVWDPEGEYEITHSVPVPWDTVKRIMAAIRGRAAEALSQTHGEGA